MKRILMLCTLIALMIFPSSAMAKNTYFGIKGVIANVSSESEPEDWYGTYSTVEKSFSQGGLGIVFGQRLIAGSVAFRLEFENTMRFGSEKLDHNPQGIRLKTEIGFHNSTLFNAYIDFPITTVFTPYIGVSAGLSLVSYDAEAWSSGGGEYTKKDLSAAVQAGLGGGLEFKLSEKFSLDASVRYLWTGGHKVEFGDSALKTNLAVDVADFSLGLRYYF